MQRLFRCSPSNEEVDAICLTHGHAFTLRTADYNTYVVTSTLEEAKELQKQGYKAVGEIHRSDFYPDW